GSERVQAAIHLSFVPQAVAAGNGAVWLVDQSGSAIVRVDPRTHRLTRIRVGRQPEAVAVGPRAVWVANRGDGTLSKIDPSRRVVEKVVSVGSQPVDLVVGLGAV